MHSDSGISYEREGRMWLRKQNKRLALLPKRKTEEARNERKWRGKAEGRRGGVITRREENMKERWMKNHQSFWLARGVLIKGYYNSEPCQGRSELQGRVASLQPVKRPQNCAPHLYCPLHKDCVSARNAFGTALPVDRSKHASLETDHTQQCSS